MPGSCRSIRVFGVQMICAVVGMTTSSRGGGGHGCRGGDMGALGAPFVLLRRSDSARTDRFDQQLFGTTHCVSARIVVAGDSTLRPTRAPPDLTGSTANLPRTRPGRQQTARTHRDTS